MKRSERGFTIIELLVVMAIVALITGAATMTTPQLVKGTERNSDHMTAVCQVQNAGYWISHDALMAQNIVTGDDPETPEHEFITLDWSDWENGDVHKITYTFEDMPGGLKKLKRQHLICNADGVEIGNKMTLIAEYINSASLSEQDSTWKLTIQACLRTETETRDYEIRPRVNL